MKILNSTAINGNMSKLIETPDNFIINGQLYDKSTFSPVPMSFCPINVSANNEILLNQTAYINSCWFRNTTTCGYILDSSDSNICYICIQGLAANFGTGIMKIVKNPNGSYTNTFYQISVGYHDFVDIIGQDNTKIYYTMNREYSGAYSYICTLDKLSMTSINTNINGATFKILKVTDMYIYFMANGVSVDTIYIGKFNKITSTNTWLLTDVATAGSYWTSNISSDINTSGVFYARRDGKGFGLSDHYIAFRKYVLDVSKDTCVASNVILDNSKYPTAQIPLYTTSYMAPTCQMFRYTDSITGKKYMSVLQFNNGTQYTQLDPRDSGIFTYEMIDDDHWTLVSWTNFNPIMYKAVLPISNNQTLVLGYENGIHIWNWNSGTTSYQKVTSIDVPIFAFGLDNNNNLYVQYADKSIDMISNVMPINVYCDFEKDEYSYSSTNILSNINLYVQNYQNKYLSTTVQLTLYGNCKFTSNNSRTLTVTTSNLDKMQIPVTIYGEGNLEVAFKLL